MKKLQMLIKYLETIQIAYGVGRRETKNLLWTL